MRKLAITFFSLSGLLVAGFTSSALASPTASQITAPTGTAYVRAQYGVTDQATPVRGTTTGTGNVDLRCYYAAGGAVTVKSGVLVTANRFDTSLSEDELASTLPTGPCVLRAVPAGDSAARPPSATSDPFQGPRLAQTFSDQQVDPTTGATDNFQASAAGGSGLFQFESSWAGIWDSRLANPSTLATTPTLFDLGSGFNGGDLINIDGSDAFVVDSISGQAGFQGLSDMRVSLDPFTGVATIHDLEPVQHDDPTPAPSGVALERTWVIGQDGRVASVRDQWRSVDGQQHTLKVRYQNQVEGTAAGGAIDFPGSAGFQNITSYSLNQQITAPQGPGSTYVKYDATTPDAGNGSSAQGSFTYSKTPDGPFKIVSEGVNGSTTYLGWELPYERTIPAGGDQTFRFSYAMDFSLTSVRALAGDAENGTRPTVAITAPTDGTSSASPTVTVNGTAADTAGTPALLVAGQATNVGADGTWSRQVTLSPGANTISAVATDADGNTTSRNVNVIYTPPSSTSPDAPSQPVAPSHTAGTAQAGSQVLPAKLSLVGGAHPTKRGVTFKIKCLNQACAGTATLQSVVRVARTKRKTETVGSGKFSLAAGNTKTVTVKLNATGRKLLKRFKRLPAKLTVALASAKPLTASAVIKP
ncbi:MAG: Glucodextranase, domain [Thermoleophilaceae bacterium]|nr:Glucodextranase, domain [Thermoleophilaceae bacterium]